MRESQGATFLFQIVIVFVLLFTGYLCLSINYARAFRVKDEVVNIVERNKGYVDVTQKEVAAYLKKVGYRTTGKCDNDIDDQNGPYTAYDANGESQGTGNKGVFCMRKVVSNSGDDETPTRVYYQVQVFYRLDLPIFSDTFVFKASGDSYQIENPLDS